MNTKIKTENWEERFRINFEDNPHLGFSKLSKDGFNELKDFIRTEIQFAEQRCYQQGVKEEREKLLEVIDKIDVSDNLMFDPATDLRRGFVDGFNKFRNLLKSKL